MKAIISAGLAAAALALMLAPYRSAIRFGAPDSRGEDVLLTPEYEGHRPDIDIPAAMHERNTVGTDGAGECVPTAATIAGRQQGVKGIEKLLPVARTRPGGYWPERFKDLVEEVLPGEDFTSLETTDTTLVTKLVKAGYPVSQTMNTGRQYNYAPIHHFVTVVGRGPLTWVIDNNDPGKWHVMPDAEFDRRAPDGPPNGPKLIWLFAWVRKAAQARGSYAAAMMMTASALLLLWWYRMRAIPAFAAMLLLAAPAAHAQDAAKLKQQDGAVEQRLDAPIENWKALGLPDFGGKWWYCKLHSGRFGAVTVAEDAKGGTVISIVPKEWNPPRRGPLMAVRLPSVGQSPTPAPEPTTAFPTGVAYDKLGEQGPHAIIPFSDPQLASIVASAIERDTMLEDSANGALPSNHVGHKPADCPSGPNSPNCPNNPKPPKKTPDKLPQLDDAAKGGHIGLLAFGLIAGAFFLVFCWILIARPFAPPSSEAGS